MNVQSKLLSKLAITCLLLTAGLLTFIGCAPETMNPVSKKAGDDGPSATSTYVAVGDGGKIALSKDFGSSWQAVDSGITAQLLDIATDGTNIVAVADNGAVVRSTDGGETWAVVSSTGISHSSSTEIEYGNGVFVTFQHNNRGAFSSGIHYEFNRSTDGGATWAKGTIESGLFTVATTSIHLAYNGSRFLAVGGSGDEGTIAVSTDGLAYTSGLGNGNLKFGLDWLALSIANGRFFIFNKLTDGFTTPNIYQSSTGNSQWTTNRSTNAMDVTTFPAAASGMFITDIAHSGSVYVFVGSIGVNIMTSATAMAGSFTVPTSPVSTQLTRIIFFKGKFVAAGASGKILNGDAAGTTWTEATSVTTEQLSIGEATANKIVFVGANGKIVVSSDGTTWAVKSATGNTTEYRSLVLIE